MVRVGPRGEEGEVEGEGVISESSIEHGRAICHVTLNDHNRKVNLRGLVILRIFLLTQTNRKEIIVQPAKSER